MGGWVETKGQPRLLVPSPSFPYANQQTSGKQYKNHYKNLFKVLYIIFFFKIVPLNVSVRQMITLGDNSSERPLLFEVFTIRTIAM